MKNPNTINIIIIKKKKKKKEKLNDPEILPPVPKAIYNNLLKCFSV